MVWPRKTKQELARQFSSLISASDDELRLMCIRDSEVGQRNLERDSAYKTLKDFAYSLQRRVERETSPSEELILRRSLISLWDLKRAIWERKISEENYNIYAKYGIQK